MFFTLQFPFVDLRRFLREPPNFVPKRPAILEPDILDFERIAANEYVRCFGHFRLRSYVPTIKNAKKRKSYEPLSQDLDWRILNLDDIWQEEYLYASTRRALRFSLLEKHNLLNGKLHHPRAKIRALRFSPLDPNNRLWTPCLRIETGILYDVSNPLEGNELIQAVNQFLKVKVQVPSYNRDGAGANAIVNKKLNKGTLIEQHAALAKLIVNGTTAQHELKVHDNMIMPGEPLVSIHYSSEELKNFPANVISIPRELTRGLKIGYYPMQRPRLGIWLFEVPDSYLESKKLAKKRDAIRNNTIAIMRYWSEFQAIISLRNAVTADSFEFYIRENNIMQNYVNNATKFLHSGEWHGASVAHIRNIINAHHIISPEKKLLIDKALKDFKRQIAEKLATIGTTQTSIFVSYSHADEEGLLAAIQIAFSALPKNSQVAYFDDTYLEAGVEWEGKIKDALENTSIAILMVSENFLNSQYIKTVEQPKIIERYQTGKLNIIPILVDGKIPSKGFLSQIQFLNGNDPLSTSDEAKTAKIMQSLTEKILSFQEADDHSPA